MSRASKVKGLTRREFVKAGALLGGAAAVLPTRAAAPAVGDAFWKQYSGTTLRIVSNDHAYPRAVRTRLAEFEKLSGMKVEIDLLGWAV